MPSSQELLKDVVFDGYQDRSNEESDEAPHDSEMHQTGKPMPSCDGPIQKNLGDGIRQTGSDSIPRQSRRLSGEHLLDVAVDSVRQHSEGQHPENVEDQFTGKGNVPEYLARSGFGRHISALSWGSVGRWVAPWTSAIAASPNPG